MLILGPGIPVWALVTELAFTLLQSLLLPESRHIAGRVVDANGKPVGGAQIENTHSQEPYETDAAGAFTFDTKAPAFVVRKRGYRSQLVRTTASSEVRVALETVNASETIPVCSGSGRYIGIDGGGWFRFPVTKGVKGHAQGRDDDYVYRDYSIGTRKGRKFLRHGSGPLWGNGAPSDSDVWQSVRYEEVSYETGGVMVIDARWQLPDGSWWRSLGRFGESVRYLNLDDAAAKVFDQVLDGACLRFRAAINESR